MLRLRHVGVVFCFVAVLAGIWLIGRQLDVDAGGTRVVIRAWGVALPELCGYRILTGHNCPGCGLTRSIVSICHGQWWRAMNFHPLGPLVLLGVPAWLAHMCAATFPSNKQLDSRDHPGATDNP
ncbi:MAG: hypothetical protein KatS3mg110_4246 [Pirellulaceae bacterium]|nr:MAG: hypothetical protein KatS3mg110_4246 [Pirellulaceae bacterium]